MSSGTPFDGRTDSLVGAESFAATETLIGLGRRSAPTPVPAEAPPAGPGVRIPAPCYFALALLAAWPLHRLWPLRIVNGPVADLAGASLCVVVAVLSGLAVRELWRRGTSMRHDRPAFTLVTSGPFRISRNPIYLALSLLVLALGLWMRNAWMPLLLPPTLLALHLLVIRREERYLRLRFGDRYERYRACVPRWI